MKIVRLAAATILLGLLALGCAREERSRIAAPGPATATKPGTRVLEARWSEGTELARAVSMASSNPLVQRAFLESGDPRLHLEPRYAIQATGVTSEGSRVRVTLLPYAREDDPRFAMLTTLIERDGRTLAQVADLIVGREPTSLEPGFEPVATGDGIVWVRGGAEYLVDDEDTGAAGAAAGAGGAAERRRFNKEAFLRCWGSQAPTLCAAGVQTCSAIAPQFPYCQALGCGAGMAVAAIYCGVRAFE